LLVALVYFPSQLQRRLPAALYGFLTSPRVLRALKIAVSIGFGRKLNQVFSQYMVNNGKRDARFIKSQELVLVTGGCSGIGELMAKQFAEKGVKVVVLDINAPKAALRKRVYLALSERLSMISDCR
jgi:all-trans-retinol dehydrogenase (NAD+)